MRKRLIELILNAPRKDVVYGNIKLDKPVQTAQSIVDHLLANGVVALPCKVGDTVYVPWRWNGEQGIGVVEVEEIKIYDSQNHIMFFTDMQSDDEEFNQSYGGWKIDKSIGKTVFLTKEEAEQALRERGVDD